MAIRKNLNPRQMDLQPEMRDILMRNGMQAHIIANGDGYQLAVQGHDSPLLTYNLTEKQMLVLTDWGNQLYQQEGVQCLYQHHRQRLLYAEKPCPCKKCQWKSGYGTAWI